MIKNIGLPWAFRILAILAFVVNGICSLLIRDRNKQVGAVHVAFNKELFKKIEFYMYISWGFFSLLSYTIVIFSLPDYAQTVGLSSSQGSVIAACFNGKLLPPGTSFCGMLTSQSVSSCGATPDWTHQ